MDEESKNLDEFLKKVDEIGDIIADLHTEDESVNSAAIQRADQYLDQVGDGNIKHDRTIIKKNKTTEISKDEFVKYVDRDIEERSKQKNVNLKKALSLKDKGNQHFKNESYLLAKQCYTEAIQLVPDNVVFYSNRAQVCLCLKEYQSAVNDCNQGLKLDSTFLKCYVRKGKALLMLERFDDALNTYEDILKINNKNKSLVADYVNEVKLRQRLKTKELEMNLKLSEDTRLQEVEHLLKKIHSGSNKVNLLPDLESLSKYLITEDQKVCFGLLKGYDIADGIEILNISKGNEHDRMNEEIIKLFVDASYACEQNCVLVSEKEKVMNFCVQCLSEEHNTRLTFQCLQLVYNISQYNRSRCILTKCQKLKQYFNCILDKISLGGDVALVALNTLNNLALDEKFLGSFGNSLSQTFIPGVFKMMEILCSLHTGDNMELVERFIPTLTSSMLTVTNLYRDAMIRKATCHKLNVWETSHTLLFKYSSDLTLPMMNKLVHSTLGMLLNFSMEKISFNTRLVENWVQLMHKLLNNMNLSITERCCGILSHVVGHNDVMVQLIIKQKMDVRFFELLKDERFLSSKKYICKCLAVLTNSQDVARNKLDYTKEIPLLMELLKDDAEVIVGNIALCFVHLSKLDIMVESLVDKQFVMVLLRQASNNKLSEQVRHNCALAIGKYTMLDKRYLEQLRDLHGLEILHAVMKDNKLTSI